MKKMRELARNAASELSTSCNLPFGDIIIIIMSALRKQEKDCELKYDELLTACHPLMTRDELSPTEKGIFTAMVNLGIKEQELAEEPLKNSPEWLSEKVTVCDKCFKASCWHGMFMCDESRNAGTIQKTRKELIELKLEHTDHMLTDKQLVEQ